MREAVVVARGPWPVAAADEKAVAVMFWFGLVLGLVAGSVVGVLAMALCRMAGDA